MNHQTATLGMSVSHRQAPTAKDLNDHQTLITRLYWDEDLNLPEVMALMENQYRFKATAKQYKGAFDRWKLKKNFGRDDMRHISRIQKRRLEEQNKTTRFELHQRPVPEHRIARSIQRSGIGAYPQVVSSSEMGCTPEYISYDTPSEYHSVVSSPARSYYSVPPTPMLLDFPTPSDNQISLSSPDARFDSFPDTTSTLENPAPHGVKASVENDDNDIGESRIEAEDTDTLPLLKSLLDHESTLGRPDAKLTFGTPGSLNFATPRGQHEDSGFERRGLTRSSSCPDDSDSTLSYTSAISGTSGNDRACSYELSEPQDRPMAFGHLASTVAKFPPCLGLHNALPSATMVSRDSGIFYFYNEWQSHSLMSVLVESKHGNSMCLAVSLATASLKEWPLHTISALERFRETVWRRGVAPFLDKYQSVMCELNIRARDAHRATLRYVRAKLKTQATSNETGLGKFKIILVEKKVQVEDREEDSMSFRATSRLLEASTTEQCSCPAGPVDYNLLHADSDSCSACKKKLSRSLRCPLAWLVAYSDCDSASERQALSLLESGYNASTAIEVAITLSRSQWCEWYVEAILPHTHGDANKLCPGAFGDQRVSTSDSGCFIHHQRCCYGPLQYSIKFSTLALTEVLLRRLGAAYDDRPFESCSSLGIAIRLNRIGHVGLLIRYGVDPALPCCGPLTPIELACVLNRTEIFVLLCELTVFDS